MTRVWQCILDPTGSCVNQSLQHVITLTSCLKRKRVDVKNQTPVLTVCGDFNTVSLRQLFLPLCPQVQVGTSHQEQRIVGYITCTHLHAIEGEYGDTHTHTHSHALAHSQCCNTHTYTHPDLLSLSAQINDHSPSNHPHAHTCMQWCVTMVMGHGRVQRQ